jgi:hypothetical protein
VRSTELESGEYEEEDEEDNPAPRNIISVLEVKALGVG